MPDQERRRFEASGWGMFPPWLAILAAYMWLACVVWVLTVHGQPPETIKAVCVLCWGVVGFWCWDRTDAIHDAYSNAGTLLVRFVLTLFWGALAVCIATPVALARKAATARG